ncbi:MAG: hypothetical protein QOH72_895 [Solirubrobacteraceae bacterium]|jgi:hypothetical protein|nr:hypothetical protein [Solirubrobacteraceae bacterium]
MNASVRHAPCRAGRSPARARAARSGSTRGRTGTQVGELHDHAASDGARSAGTGLDDEDRDDERRGGKRGAEARQAPAACRRGGLVLFALDAFLACLIAPSLCGRGWWSCGCSGEMDRANAGELERAATGPRSTMDRVEYPLPSGRGAGGGRRRPARDRDQHPARDGASRARRASTPRRARAGVRRRAREPSQSRLAEVKRCDTISASPRSTAGPAVMLTSRPAHGSQGASDPSGPRGCLHCQAAEERGARAPRYGVRCRP